MVLFLLYNGLSYDFEICLMTFLLISSCLCVEHTEALSCEGIGTLVAIYYIKLANQSLKAR